MPTFNLSLKQLSHPKKKKPKKKSTNDLQTVSKRVAFQKRRKSCLKKGSREEGYYNNQKIHIYIYKHADNTAWRRRAASALAASRKSDQQRPWA